jgi:hypothetical protein
MSGELQEYSCKALIFTYQFCTSWLTTNMSKNNYG